MARLLIEGQGTDSKGQDEDEDKVMTIKTKNKSLNIAKTTTKTNRHGSVFPVFCVSYHWASHWAVCKPVQDYAESAVFLKKDSFGTLGTKCNGKTFSDLAPWHLSSRVKLVEESLKLFVKGLEMNWKELWKTSQKKPVRNKEQSLNLEWKHSLYLDAELFQALVTKTVFYVPGHFRG